VRRQSLVASAVLTAALALVALPGVSGSQIPSSERLLTADAFQSIRLPASAGGSPLAIHWFDVGSQTTVQLVTAAGPIEPGPSDAPTPGKRVTQPNPLALLVQLERPARNVQKPVARATPAVKAPAAANAVLIRTQRSNYRRVMTGLASWYDNGTTAMRMPRGTRVKICGTARCVTRTITDWGPARYLSKRVVDLTPADFKRVTGKHLGAGLAKVTVYIY
jgi:hypothetical protein